MSEQTQMFDAGFTDTHFAETSRNFAWSKMWDAATDPA